MSHALDRRKRLEVLTEIIHRRQAVVGLLSGRGIFRSLNEVYPIGAVKPNSCYLGEVLRVTPVASGTGAWIVQVMREHLPLPIRNQLAVCLYAAGYTADLNQARAITAINGFGRAVA